MSIIKTDIVSAENDVFWNDVSDITSGHVPRPVLVITNTREHDAQLLKMLEASKLAADQYNIIYVEEGRQVAWHQLHYNLKPGVVFLIGVLPAQLGVSALFKLNEPNRYNDTIWLPSLSIAELDQRADVKKQLWLQGMKPIFVDKVYGEFSQSLK